MPGSYLRFAQHDRAARDRLAALAHGQGGVFAPVDLPEIALDDATFRRLRRRGAVRRLQHGVYADAAVIEAAMSDPVEWHLLRAAAVVRSVRREAALASTSALCAYGVAVPRRALERVQLWRPADVDRRGGQGSPASGSVCVDLEGHRAGGLPLVPPAVAAVHAACRLSPRWGLVACDGVLAAGLATIEDLRRARAALRSFDGIGKASSAVRLARRGAETPLESISRWAFHVAGLPEPELQVDLSDEEGFVGRVDMLFRAWGVVGEADGLAKYLTRDDLIAEKLREDRIRALGFEVVRWTWDEIYRRPEAVVARIREAASRRPSRR